MPPPGRWLPALLVVLLSGCAGNVELRHEDPLDELSRLERAPVLDPASVDEVDALALDENAIRFIEARTAGIEDPYEKVRALRSAARRASALPPSPNKRSKTTRGCASDGSGVVGDDQDRQF